MTNAGRLTADDMVIAMLADTEAELCEHLVALEADAKAYRDLAHEAIRSLSIAIKERDRARKRLQALLDVRRHPPRVA